MKAAVLIAFSAMLSPMLVAPQEQPTQIKHIDVVMLSHLDVGFTDQPYLVVNELQRRFLDVALDASIATANEPPAQRFYWTAESQSLSRASPAVAAGGSERANGGGRHAVQLPAV
jgi:hypothetical protein